MITTGNLERRPMTLLERIAEVNPRDIGQWDAPMAALRGRHRGLPTEARRNAALGYWMAYVGVPWWRLDVLIPALLWGHHIDCTYVSWGGRFKTDGPLPRGTLWFGVDFAGLGDAFPVVDQTHPQLAEGTYRSAADVKLAQAELADQIMRLSWR